MFDYVEPTPRVLVNIEVFNPNVTVNGSNWLPAAALTNTGDDWVAYLPAGTYRVVETAQVFESTGQTFGTGMDLEVVAGIVVWHDGDDVFAIGATDYWDAKERVSYI